MLLRLKTNLGICRLKISRADDRLTLRELKAFIRDTLHVELPKVISSSSSADGGSIDGATTSAIPNIVLSRDGTRSTIFARQYDDIHLSDLNIVHGSEIYLMGQYVVKERVKVTVNDDGDLLPAGSFYTRIDECDFSQELDGDDDGGGATIHASIDGTVAVISRSDHHPLVLGTHNEHLMQQRGGDRQEIVSPIDDNHLGSSRITFEERADEPNLHTVQEDAAHIPRSAYIPVHDDDYVDQQLRSTISQLPGAAAFIYDASSSYQDNNNNNYVNNYDLSDYDVDDVRPNSLDEHEWMVDSGPNDDIRPADSTQRLTLLGDDYYSAPFGFSYSDASTTAVMTTPRLSQSDEV
jgi:hypothetical protein